MNKLLKTTTFTFAVIATINIFSACSKEENTPSINIDQLYQNINGPMLAQQICATVKIS